VRIARVVRVAGLLALAASVGVAGEAPSPGSSKFRVGVGVMVASGLGSMSSDVNHHPGFGFTVQGYFPVGSRFQVRPAFEWTGYRVNEYNFASHLLAEVLGENYEETRVVFRTYRVGIDGVLYFRDRYCGPFLSGGIGLQHSRVYLEDVLWQGSEQGVTPIDAAASTDGLWLGGGVGYQWASANLELRLSRAPYSYTTARPANGPTNAFPFEPRPGWALHLIMAVIF
jgi:hypothetical protein